MGCTAVRLSTKIRTSALGILAAGICGAASLGQTLSSLDRERAEDMLNLVVRDVKKHYYDPNLHGVDLDARSKEARQRIESAQSLGQAFTAIGWTIDGLNDSHTHFLPPRHTLRTDYGFRMQVYGDACFVTAVKPGSDAEAKGLKRGDQVLTVNGFRVLRDEYSKFEYVFYRLQPQPRLRLGVRSPEGAERTLEILSRQHEEKAQYSSQDFWQFVREGEDAAERSRTQYFEEGDEILLLKLKSFVVSDRVVDEILGKMHGKKAVLFDLRGNGGGLVDVLARLLGVFFDHEVLIGNRIGRDQKKPQVTKPSKPPFTGQAVVLVDSQSASASELFARVLQLEKRGTLVGDRSAGLVMEARVYQNHLGMESEVFFGTEITDADIQMTDGRSLEHEGVKPDVLILPTAQDLATGRDPVLSRGAALLGFNIPPDKAGTMFSFKWPKD